MKNIISFLQVHTYDITGVGNADEINQALTIGLPIIGAAIICLFLFNNGEKSVINYRFTDYRGCDYMSISFQ